MAWDDNDDGFGTGGFGNSGFNSNNSSSGGGGFTKQTGGFGSKGGFNKSVSFKNIGNSSSSTSNPRPSGIGWKKPVKDWGPVEGLNKMISVHNIPFFGQTQAFMGKTLWDFFKRSKAHFSDIIDRLNCHIVPMFLMFFVMMISANIFGAFGMEPMRCLRSPELNEEEREYALDYCQSKNTYYVAPEEGIPWSNKERRERQLGYYHWVPIMMFLQAMLFMLPNWLWKALNQQSGILYIQFIEEATRLKSMSITEPERPQLVQELSERMCEAILNREVYFRRRMVGCRVGRCMGSYVSMLYVSIKFLYLLNVTAQFLVLNSFIGASYRFWGLEVMQALIAGENWQDSPIFPRLTLCDVPIRRLGDTPRYTLQCHLRINTYNEKIYLFIWWGFLLVSMLTFFNFLYYLLVLILLPCTQENSVRHLLKQDRHEHIIYSNKKSDKKLVKRFAEDALRKDGILLFWFIESHAGPIAARELLGEIFEYYKGKSHYEDEPSEVKTGKQSFSSQSTGSLDDDEWGNDDGEPRSRFGNGVTPTAPKMPPGESASFSSSQERELIDGGDDTTESTHLYSSTPKHGGHRHANGGKHNGRPSDYYGRPSRRDRHDRDEPRSPNIFTRIFRYITGSGGANQHYYRQNQQLRLPFTTGASYYGGAPVKNV